MIGAGIAILIIVFLILTKCGTQSPFKDDPFKDRTDNQIDLDQGVTVKAQPTDSLFANFAKFWPTLISTKPELSLPVITLGDDDDDREEPWNPRVSSSCIFSEEAGAVLPEVTLTWAERIGNLERLPRRSDLTVHYLGFQRNLYSTSYPIEPATRFIIPGNSEFIQDTAAVLLTGTTLFPQVRAFDTKISQNQTSTSTGQSESQESYPEEYEIYSVTLKDLSPGLSYTIRLCTFSGKEWHEEKSFVFTTPICKNKF